MKRLLCILLACLIGFSSANVAQAVSPETQEALDKAREEQKKAEQQKKDLEKNQGSISNKKSDMEKYLKSLNQQANSLEEQVYALNDAIKETEAEIETKKEEVAEAEQEVDKQYMDMKKRIQYMYENNQSTLLVCLATALTEGVSNMLNQAEYAVSIGQYDRNMLTNYQAAKTDLETQKAELEEEQEALEVLKEETEKKQREVADQQKAAGSKLSEFEEQMKALEDQIGDAKDVLAQKEKLLNDWIKKAEAEEAAARLAAAQNQANSMEGGVIVGDANISHHVIGLSDYELLMLAVMIYCESGGEPYEGQLAVGYVIMNRVRSSLYPNSLERVLKQSKQFEPYGSGKFDLIMKAEQDPSLPNKVTQSCWNAAQTVVNGSSNVGDSLFFRTWKPVPSLIENLKKNNVPYWIIQNHVFYYYWTSYSTGTKPKEEPKEEPKDDGDDDKEEEKPKEEQKPPTTANPTTPTEPTDPNTATPPTEEEDNGKEGDPEGDSTNKDTDQNEGGEKAGGNEADNGTDGTQSSSGEKL